MFDYSLKNYKKGPPDEKWTSVEYPQNCSFITDKFRNYIKNVHQPATKHGEIGRWTLCIRLGDDEILFVDAKVLYVRFECKRSCNFLCFFFQFSANKVLSLLCKTWPL